MAVLAKFFLKRAVKRSAVELEQGQRKPSAVPSSTSSIAGVLGHVSDVDALREEGQPPTPVGHLQRMSWRLAVQSVSQPGRTISERAGKQDRRRGA